MVERLLELAQRPRVLQERLHPPTEPKLRPSSKNLQRLMERLKMRVWVPNTQDYLMSTVIRLRQEVKFIEHLPHCWVHQMELQLDVERYMGNHSFWWCCLENNQYLERRYRNAPKERDYHIGNYWEQLQYYREHGNTDVPGQNTLEFIFDRSKWAYKIYGKQIRTLRRLLCMVRSWDFKFNANQDELLDEYFRIYNQLDMYDVAMPYI